MLHGSHSTVALFIAIALGACSRPHTLFMEEPTPPAPSLSQVSVVQADSLVVDGRRLHMIDAVTPQPAPFAGCPAEALAAHQARLRMSALAARTRHVDVKLTGTIDDYNRANAHLSFDGQDPAQLLIDDGLAVAPGASSFSWCGPLSAGFPQAAHLAKLSLSGS